MKPQPNSCLPEILKRWRAEDAQLESYLDGVRDWMSEVNQLGLPRFGETANRLQPLRIQLVEHFDREDEMTRELATCYPPSSPEIQAVRRQSSEDHAQLLARLDDLIDRLGQIEPPFDSWEAAVYEVDLFVDVLEQHEEQEAESVEILMPNSSYQPEL